MGKSKTVNALVMNEVARVGEISASLGIGTHTTTFSRMFRLDRDAAIIDTPGFQSFGLFHLTEGQIAEAMREFRPFLGTCKFNDCVHLTEPGCADRGGQRRGRHLRRAPVVLPGAASSSTASCTSSIPTGGAEPLPRRFPLSPPPRQERP